MAHNVTKLPQVKGNKSHVKQILLYTCQICLTIFWHMVCQIRLKWMQQRIIVKHFLINICQLGLCAGARFTVYLQCVYRNQLHSNVSKIIDNHCILYFWRFSLPQIGCPRNKLIFFSVRTETNRNSICFGSFSVCFAKPITIIFGLFWCFGPVSKQPKQTDLFRNKPKNRKNT
jgi:hypothetical protein